jgi:hypothetical protein
MTRITWIEVLIVVAILLMIGSMVWRHELVELENRMFESIGLGGPLKYLVSVPIGILYFYSIYRREARKHKKVIRMPVIVFSIASLIGVALYLVFVVGAGNGT